MPVGINVWWTEALEGVSWSITDVTPVGSGSEVTLVLQTIVPLDAGSLACANESVLTAQHARPYEVHCRPQPWTHRPKSSPRTKLDLDSEGRMTVYNESVILEGREVVARRSTGLFQIGNEGAVTLLRDRRRRQEPSCHAKL